MKRILVKILYLLFAAIVLGGCWDQKEIDRKDYVVAIGIDQDEDQGIKMSLLTTNPEVGSVQQGGTTNEPPTEIITLKTKDLLSPINFSNTVVAREISLDMLRYIIVSEELAKTNNFIRWMYETTKNKDIRRDNFLIITKEDTSQFIEKNKPRLETRVHKYYENIIRRGQETGTIPFSQLHTYFRVTEADADLFLGIYATREVQEEKSEANDQLFAGQFKPGGTANKTEFLGSAVFKEGKMIGKLTGEETRLSYLLNNIDYAQDMLISIPDPFNKNFNMSIRVSQQKDAAIHLDLFKGNGTIRVNVPLIIDVLSDHSMVNYADHKKKREQLRKHIENRFERRLNDFVKKTQEEFKGEPFGWSLYARRKFTNVHDYHKYNWMEKYPNMDVRINVEVKISEYGRQTKLPNLQKVRD